MSEDGTAAGASPAPIALLFDRLRESGYLIGVDQYVAAEALVSRMRADGNLRDADHLCRTLCAMVAKTSDQQRDFPVHFETWSRAFPGPRPAEPAPRLEEITDDVRRTGRRIWIAFAVIVVAVLVAVTVLVATGVTTLPQLQTTFSSDAAPTTDTGTHATQTSQGYGALLSVLAGGALLLFLLVRAVRTRQFVRRFSTVRPLLFDLGLKSVPSVLAPVKPMREAAQSLGRYDRVPTRRLDARATAAATARKGVPIVVYRDLPTVPEYLVLTDVGSADDHLAAAAAEYCERLAAGGLMLHRFNFRHDPSQLIARDGRVVPLARILERSSQARLIVFSDASGFGTDTGTPSWATGLNVMLHKVLFTPRPPAARGATERRLTELGFHVDVPDLDGIDRFATTIGQGTQPTAPPSQLYRPYPSILGVRPHRWLDDVSPDVTQVEKLVAQLRTYLGADGFRWLAATAVFPRLILPITLHVMRPAGGMLADFGPLISLPWFRHGRMPDWLRLRLIEDLGDDDATRVRDTLQDLFISATNADPANPTLEVACHQGAKLRPALLRLLRTEPPGSPFREYIFLEFMSGRRIAPEAFGVPRHVRQLLRARTSTHARREARPIRQNGSSASGSNSAANVPDSYSGYKKIIIGFEDISQGRISASSNVERLLRAVLQTEDDGTPQIKAHFGTLERPFISRIVDRISPGSNNEELINAYLFICKNYEAGDGLYFFGAGLGATNARSLVGLIRKCGIANHPERNIQDIIRLYRHRGRMGHPDSDRVLHERMRISPEVATSLHDLRKRDRPTELLRISYIGIFDTIGALGVPSGILTDFLGKRHQFHDTNLSSIVTSADHAVALDETNASRPPALWANLDELNVRSQGADPPYRQLWFSGTHSVVCGATERRGLSSIPLLWIAEGARRAGLGIDPSFFVEIKAEIDPLEAISRSGGANLVKIRRGLSAQSDEIHPSVLWRYKSGGGTEDERKERIELGLVPNGS